MNLEMLFGRLNFLRANDASFHRQFFFLFFHKSISLVQTLNAEGRIGMEKMIRIFLEGISGGDFRALIIMWKPAHRRRDLLCAQMRSRSFRRDAVYVSAVAELEACVHGQPRNNFDMPMETLCDFRRQ